MYDIIVVGAGASGMTAALYALRNGKTVLVLEGESLGGQIATSPRLENYPSIKEISGEQFADNLFEQITALGAELEIDKVTEIIKNGEGDFTVKTEYNEFKGKSVIIATGVKHKHLRTKDDRDDLVGKGVYYCAICDGAFYKDKEVALVGDANTALQYALLLSSYCKKVYMYTLFDKFFGDERLQRAVRAKDNIEIRPNTSVLNYVGEKELEAIEYKDADGEIKRHKIPAVFIAIGQVPDNKAFTNVVDLDKDGYIIADETCRTKTKGVFVAGDCRTKPVRQVATAVADGAVASTQASIYLESLN
ncbi:MAG: FAD-dependent oxidoreductase [Clostridia bacterium]|nr:FAD-dependent oxidoreductase [Clostridia bacterium]MBQ9514282.1 FAD-dependent oxidoreductase [Clostridia bacterium]